MSQTSNLTRLDGVETTLLLVRPKARSMAFLAEFEERLGRKVPHILSPILQIKQVAEVPDLANFETVILTSGHAVDIAGDRLRETHVLTVGERTAALAQGFGAYAQCLGKCLAEFTERLAEVRPPACHLRGVHARGGLVEKAGNSGILIEEFVIYDQITQALTEPAKALLLSGGAVVPVFSPRTAALLGEYPCHPETQFVAISKAAAENFSGNGRVIVADSPDLSAILRICEAAF